MKKLILVLGIVLMGLSVWGQRAAQTGSFRVPDGADTTVWLSFFTGDDYGINFDYSAFDDVDGILDLGFSMHADSNKFDRIDDDRLPFTLADSSVTFYDISFPSGVLGIKLTKGSNTSGLLLYYWIWRQ